MSDPPTKQLLKANWLFSGASPLQRDAGVVILDDRVLDVGGAKDLQRRHPDAKVCDLANAIIVPGLVNAHTHFELYNLHPPAEPGSFVKWLLQLMAGPPPSSAEQSPASMASLSSLRYGVTAVGDICRRVMETRRALGKYPRAVSYGEVTGMGTRRNAVSSKIDDATNASDIPDRRRIGISPHAPYSTEFSAYRRCLDRAVRKHLPLTTHLAESPDEAAFLANHDGPFRELWNMIGGWDDLIPKFEGGPIRFAKAIGLLDYSRTSLAHVNYCDNDELALLAAGRASVVYCPRTHKYFSHPRHRWRDMLAAGINVALGTDSCASSPNLNLLHDLRLVHRIAPDFPAEQIWQMATANGAKALDWEDHIGSLAPGKFADFVIFEVKSDNPLHEILEDENCRPTQVWIAGQSV